MKYRMIATDPATRRLVSVLSLGAMLMGTRTDEQTSFAILDRFVSAGGNFIDTSGNYAFWVNGTQGGESEELLGRWRPSRRVSDVVIATKVGRGRWLLVFLLAMPLWGACRRRFSGSRRRGAWRGWACRAWT